MALSSATLSSALQAVVPSLSVTSGIATAYGEYMKGAVAASPIIQAAIPAAVTAMAGVLNFTSGMTADQGAGVLLGGCQVFWGAMNTGPASSFFAGALTVSVPNGLFDLATRSALAAAFTANTADGITLVQACDAVAAVLHAASLGGFAGYPGPSSTPVT